MENNETPTDDEVITTKILRKRSEDLNYAYIRDLEMDNGFRHAFIRLVPTREDGDIHTYDWDDVSVDVDDDGNILGVTLTRYPEGTL